jgi:cell wall-associated NlpC family hydrolase
MSSYVLEAAELLPFRPAGPLRAQPAAALRQPAQAGPEHGTGAQIAASAQTYPGVDHRAYQYEAPDGSKEFINCSNFTQEIAAKNGYKLPDGARYQAKAFADQADWDTKFANIQVGDFIYFGNRGTATHTGVVVRGPGGQLAVVHASGAEGVKGSIKQTVLNPDGSLWPGKSQRKFLGFGRPNPEHAYVGKAARPQPKAAPKVAPVAADTLR